jgi:hypothetical protein
MASLKDYVEILPMYTEKAYKLRGEVINQTIQLERVMDAFIASHFCSDETKRTELMILILCTERITFENKRQVLKWIVENHEKGLIEVHAKLFKNLQEIGEFRNLLAHTYLDIENFVDNVKSAKIALKKYKNQIDIIKLTEKEINEKIKVIEFYTNVLTYWHNPHNFPL